MKPKRSPRSQLIYALSYCVESLADGSLMEGSGAIRAALRADDRVWEQLSERTLQQLDSGLGLTQPLANPKPETKK